MNLIDIYTQRFVSLHIFWITRPNKSWHFIQCRQTVAGIRSVVMVFRAFILCFVRFQPKGLLPWTQNVIATWSSSQLLLFEHHDKRLAFCLSNYHCVPPIGTLVILKRLTVIFFRNNFLAKIHQINIKNAIQNSRILWLVMCYKRMYRYVVTNYELVLKRTRRVVINV